MWDEHYINREIAPLLSPTSCTHDYNGRPLLCRELLGLHVSKKVRRTCSTIHVFTYPVAFLGFSTEILYLILAL